MRCRKRNLQPPKTYQAANATENYGGLKESGDPTKLPDPYRGEHGEETEEVEEDYRGEESFDAEHEFGTGGNNCPIGHYCNVNTH